MAITPHPLTPLLWLLLTGALSAGLDCPRRVHGGQLLRMDPGEIICSEPHLLQVVMRGEKSEAMLTMHLKCACLLRLRQNISNLRWEEEEVTRKLDM